MMKLIHAAHDGVGGCVRHARETLYWPCSRVIKDYISKCDTCLSHRDMPSKEPLQQHEFAARSWSKVSTDLYHGTLINVRQIWHPGNINDGQWSSI